MGTYPMVRAPRPGLRAAIALAVEACDQPLTLSDLALAAAMPPNTLTRRFNRAYGQSPMRWIWSFRTVLAAEFIALSPGWPLGEIAARCGFGSAAHFSRRFQEIFRMSPSHFRALASAQGADVRPRLSLKDPYTNFYDLHGDAVRAVIGRFRAELHGRLWTASYAPDGIRIP